MLLEQFGECLRAWERDSKPERCIKCSYLSKTDGKTEIVTPRAPEVHCFHVTISLRLRAADVQGPQVWAGGEMSGHQTCQWPPVLLRDAQRPGPLLKTVIIIILGPITGQGYCPLPSQSFSLSKIQLSVFCEEPVPRDNLVKKRLDFIWNVLVSISIYLWKLFRLLVCWRTERSGVYVVVILNFVHQSINNLLMLMVTGGWRGVT